MNLRSDSGLRDRLISTLISAYCHAEGTSRVGLGLMQAGSKGSGVFCTKHCADISHSCVTSHATI